MSQSNLDRIADAVVRAEGSTPDAVIDALCPPEPILGGITLLPVTAGMWLALEKLRHPFVSRDFDDMGTESIAQALYVFSQSSRQTLQEIRRGQFEDKLAEMLDTLPLNAMETMASAVMGHFASATASALRLESPSSDVQKKTADSDFC